MSPAIILNAIAKYESNAPSLICFELLFKIPSPYYCQKNLYFGLFLIKYNMSTPIKANLTNTFDLRSNNSKKEGMLSIMNKL
jgi:hypothetical protein